MPGEGGEKTEKASPKKREDERKKGNIFQSKDVTTIVSLLAAFFTMQFFTASFLEQVQLNYANQMRRALTAQALGAEDMMALIREGFLLFAQTILPALAVMALVSVVAVGAQTRFLFSYEQIKFKFERIDPLRGFRRLFSLRSLVELVKSILKITLLTWLLYGNVRKVVALLPAMIDWDINQAAAYTGGEIMSLIVSVGIAFGAVAAADFLYQWWEYERNIRMTKQEVKDEYKQMEGNPEVKSARRQKQREFAMNRMMQKVKEADVVVRNPTHFAVALKYTIDVDPAPMILAKGQDLVALKIVEEAEKHGVATVENKPLARGLYEAGNIEDLIPAEFYQPVAELLAWLYSTKEKEKHKR